MKLGPHGQIKIPDDVRQRLGWEAEAELEFVESGNRLTLVPAGNGKGRPDGVDERPDDALTMREFLERYAGSADGGLTTDEVMAMTRGED